MTCECLVARLGRLALTLIPKGLEDHDLSLEELEGYRQRVNEMFDAAEQKIRADAQWAAEDVADDIHQQEQDERA